MSRRCDVLPDAANRWRLQIDGAFAAACSCVGLAAQRVAQRLQRGVWVRPAADERHPYAQLIHERGPTTISFAPGICAVNRAVAIIIDLVLADGVGCRIAEVAAGDLLDAVDHLDPHEIASWKAPVTWSVRN